MSRLAKAERQNAGITKLAEATKRAFMMLPLLPRELIGMDVVELIVKRWTDAFPRFRHAFDDLRRHLEEYYVGPHARFPPHLWSVSGRKIRTNNAAESSHTRLNAPLRQKRVVSIREFLRVIEADMHNVSKEIRAGCQPHTKRIFETRNKLLRAELVELLSGHQSVLKFLDHCSSVELLENEASVSAYFDRRIREQPDADDVAWIRANRQRVVDAAMALHKRLLPCSKMTVTTVMPTIGVWIFPDIPCIVFPDAEDENSELSLVPETRRDSFIEIMDEIDN